MYRILAFSIAVAIVPLFSQTPAPKPSFEVISIKRTAPSSNIEGFGAVGDRFNVTGGTLRFLLNIYSRANNGPSGDLQIINAPNWIDADRFDIDAKVDCSVGKPSREQL